MKDKKILEHGVKLVITSDTGAFAEVKGLTAPIHLSFSPRDGKQLSDLPERSALIGVAFELIALALRADDDVVEYLSNWLPQFLCRLYETPDQKTLEKALAAMEVSCD